MPLDKEIKVVFVDKKLKEAYLKLKNSKTEDKLLFEWLNRAFDDLKKKPFCGIQIPKSQIPRTYIKNYGIDNLWKYNLPEGWRLIYSVIGDEVRIISIVIEWLGHKRYERRFGY